MKIGYQISNLSDFFDDYNKKSGNIIIRLEKIPSVSKFLRNSGIYNVDSLCIKNTFNECKECSQILLYAKLYPESVYIDTQKVTMSGNLEEKLMLDDFSIKIAINHYLYPLTELVDFPITAYLCGDTGKIVYNNKESATNVTKKDLIDIFSSLHPYQYTLDSTSPEFYQYDEVVHRLPSEIGINISDVRTTGYIVLPHGDNTYIKEIKDDYFVLDLDSKEKIKDFRRLRLLGLIDSDINTSINIVISALFLHKEQRLDTSISSFFIVNDKFFYEKKYNNIFSVLNDIKIKFLI